MTTPRIRVPTLFDGNWDSVIISTYGADLAFFERDLWRQIERAKNRIIFADGRQVTRQLLAVDAAHLRHVNRTYVLAQLRTMHAAHAKLILLLAEDRGLLAVGSGNIGMNGYASQGECFTTYHWSEAEPQHSDAFIAATLAKFTWGAKLAFLVLGPMLDVKLIFLYQTVMRRRFIMYLSVSLFVVIWLASVLAQTWLIETR